MKLRVLIETVLVTGSTQASDEIQQPFAMIWPWPVLHGHVMLICPRAESIFLETQWVRRSPERATFKEENRFSFSGKLNRGNRTAESSADDDSVVIHITPQIRLQCKALSVFGRESYHQKLRKESVKRDTHLLHGYRAVSEPQRGSL